VPVGGRWSGMSQTARNARGRRAWRRAETLAMDDACGSRSKRALGPGRRRSRPRATRREPGRICERRRVVGTCLVSVLSQVLRQRLAGGIAFRRPPACDLAIHRKSVGDFGEGFFWDDARAYQGRIASYPDANAPGAGRRPPVLVVYARSNPDFNLSRGFLASAIRTATEHFCPPATRSTARTKSSSSNVTSATSNF